MICTNCNKTIDEDSKFCQFCGGEIKEELTKNEVTLWQAFADLSFEEDKNKRQENRKLIPMSIKEMIKRFSTNMYDSLKEENESLLDISYEILEEVKNSYYFLAEDGYWIYLADKEMNKKNTAHLEDIEIDKLAELWNVNFIKEFDKGRKMVKDEVADAIVESANIQLNHLLEKYDELKKQPARVIEEIKKNLFIMPFWVYGCCLLIEKKGD